MHAPGKQLTAQAAAYNAAETVEALGFLGGVLLIAQIGYIVYKAWALCHGQASEAYATVHGSFNPNTTEFDPNLFAKARRRVASKVRRKRLPWNDHEIDTFTRELLLEVIHSDEASVASACSSLRSESPTDEDDVAD